MLRAGRAHLGRNICTGEEAAHHGIKQLELLIAEGRLCERALLFAIGHQARNVPDTDLLAPGQVVHLACLVHIQPLKNVLHVLGGAI